MYIQEGGGGNCFLGENEKKKKRGKGKMYKVAFRK